jgi:hypothetical protein
MVEFNKMASGNSTVIHSWWRKAIIYTAYVIASMAYRSK